jgi:hypothetical protein
LGDARQRQGHLALLATISDPRRAEGKLNRLPHVLLFSNFAIVSGANSYRGIQTSSRRICER